MKLVFLGTGGYHPSEQRHTACLMLPTEGIVLDAGTALFRARDHIQTNSLDILLSHIHLDHVVGITFLFDTLYGKNVDRVSTYAEPSKIDVLQNHLLHELLFPISPPTDFRPLSESQVIGNCQIRTCSTTHPGGSLAFRLDWKDRSMAYVTDTVASLDAPYLDLIQGVDLLVHECYFEDAAQDAALRTGHSWTTAVAEVARAADAGMLAVVHVNPMHNVDDPIGLDQIKRIFPNAFLGRDGMEIDF